MTMQPFHHRLPAQFTRMLGTLALLCAATGVSHAALVGYWTFDGDTAAPNGAVANSVSATFNGYQVGTVNFSNDTPGALGGGQSLDLTAGGANYVVISNSSNTQTAAYGSTGGSHDGRYDTQFGGGFVISAWIKGLPDSAWEPFISMKGEADHGYQLRRYNVGNNLGTTVRLTAGSTADDIDSGIAINDGQWRQATMIWTGQNQVLYVDGNLVFINPHAGTFGAPTNEFLVFGARDNPAGTIGADSHIRLDDVAMFNSVIAPKQVEFLGTGGSPLNLSAAPTISVSDFSSNSGFVVRTVHSNGTIGDIFQAVASLESGAGTITTGITYDINYYDAGGGGPNGHLGGDAAFPGFPSGGNDMAMLVSGKFAIDQAGVYTIYARGDDGFSLRVVGDDFTSVTDTGDGTAFIYGDTMLNSGQGGNVNGFGVITLDAGVHLLEYVFFERSGGAYAEVFIAPGVHTSFNSNDFTLLTAVPEPQSVALGLVAAASLGLLVWRRRNAA